jgi:hypothetical protein
MFTRFWRAAPLIEVRVLRSSCRAGRSVAMPTPPKQLRLRRLEAMERRRLPRPAAPIFSAGNGVPALQSLSNQLCEPQ